MKTVKQILEHRNIANDKDFGEKLKAISDAGLLEEGKMHLLKQAMKKSHKDLTLAEKKVMDELLSCFILNEKKDNLGQDYLSKMDTRRPAAYPSDKEIPAVIILKRKAIRVFPDNQKIAMYYSQALNKYISVPYGPRNDALGMHLSEAKYDLSDVDPEIASHPDVKAMFSDRKTPKKLTTKDVIERLPAGHPLKAGTKIGRKAIRSQAIKGYLGGRKSGAQATGEILGTGLAALGTGIAKGTKSISQKIKSVVDARKAASEPQLSNVKAKERQSFTPTPGSTPPPALAGLRTRNKVKTKKRALQIKKKNPDQVFSAGAKSTMKESFLSNVDTIREEKQLNEFIPAVVAGAAIRAAAPYAARLGMRALSKLRKIKKPSSKKPGSSVADDAADSVLSNKKSFMKRGSRRGGNLSKLKRRGRRDFDVDVDLPDNRNKDDNQSPSSGESAMDKAKRVGRDMSTARSDYNLGSRDLTRVSDVKNIFYDPSVQTFGGRPTTTIGRRQSVNESTNFDKLQFVASKRNLSEELDFGDKSITINSRVAKKVMNVYESLNYQNKKKVKTMMNEDVNSFRKLINFAIRQ